MRPAPTDLALVGLGGAIGTALRLGLTLTLPDLGDLPTTIGAINVVGAALLGLLVGSLSASKPPHASRWRLLLGTGALGGFTTYSAFSVDVVELIELHPGLAMLYAGGSVGLGVCAATLGWLGGTVLGRKHLRGRESA